MVPMPVPRGSLTQKAENRLEARWPAIVAALAIGTLMFALPEPLTLGPAWLLLAVIVVLMIPTTIFHRAGRHDLNDILGYTMLGLITVAVFSSLVLLITRLPGHKD